MKIHLLLTAFFFLIIVSGCNQSDDERLLGEPNNEVQQEMKIDNILNGFDENNISSLIKGGDVKTSPVRIDSKTNSFVYDVTVSHGEDKVEFTIREFSELLLTDDNIAITNIDEIDGSYDYIVNDLGKIIDTYTATDKQGNKIVLFNMLTNIYKGVEFPYPSLYILDLQTEKYHTIDKIGERMKVSSEGYIYTRSNYQSSWVGTSEQPIVYNLNGEQNMIFIDAYYEAIRNHLKKENYTWYQKAIIEDPDFASNFFTKRGGSNGRMGGISGYIKEIQNGIATVAITVHDPFLGDGIVSIDADKTEAILTIPLN